MESVKPAVQTVTKYAIPLVTGAYLAKAADETANEMLRKYKWPIVIAGGVAAIMVLDRFGMSEITMYPK